MIESDHDLSAFVGGVLCWMIELLVSVACRFFSIGGEEIRPAREHVAREMIGDDRARVEPGREDHEELGIIELVECVEGEGALALEDLLPDGNGVAWEGRLVCVLFFCHLGSLSERIASGSDGN